PSAGSCGRSAAADRRTAGTVGRVTLPATPTHAVTCPRGYHFLPPYRITVAFLQAPPHGNQKANTKDPAGWARPWLVVSCQGPPHWPAREPNPYTAKGAHYLGTWPHGAVTVRSGAGGLVVETHRTGQRLVLPDGRPD